MQLNEIHNKPSARKNRKRVGRGIASGTGKTSGKGHKGQKSRSGVSLLGFEGGQMPLYRRLPKRGFKNPFTKDFAELTLATLERSIKSGKIDPKKPIDEDLLRNNGIVRKSRNGVRLLATGELNSKINIEISGATSGAFAAVEKAGGKITLIPSKEKPEGKGKSRHRKFKEKSEISTSDNDKGSRAQNTEIDQDEMVDKDKKSQDEG